MTDSSRRRFLEFAALAGGIGVAGCTGLGDGGDGDGGSTGDSGGGDGGSTTSADSANWVHDVPQTPADETDEVIFVNGGGIDGDPATKYHAETFAEEYGIEATWRVVPTSELLVRNRSFLQSESSDIDVYQSQTAITMDLGSKGFLERLDDHLETVDSWVPAAKQHASLPADMPAFEGFPYPDGVYAVPWFSNMFMMYTNFTVLEEAGLSSDLSPQTFSEVLDACDQLSDVVDTPMIFPFSRPTDAMNIMDVLVTRAGGHYYDDGSPDVVNEGTVSAIDFILSLISNGYSPQGVTSLTEGQTYSNFYGDNAGLMFGSGNAISGVEGQSGDKPNEEVSRIHLFPVADDQNFDETPSVGLRSMAQGFLSIYSPVKEAGAMFLNHITKQEQQAKELLMEGNLPLRADVFDLEEVQEQIPYPETFKAAIGNSTGIVTPNPSQLETTFYEEMTAAIANDRGADETAQQIQSRLEQL